MNNECMNHDRLNPNSMKNVFSNIFQTLAPSSTLNINESVSRLWQEGRRVYHLGFGESRFAVHPKLIEALNIHASQKSYLAAQGLPELREHIGRFYSEKLHVNVAADQVIVGPGSKALIYGIQMALDVELLLPVPCWVSYAPQAHLLNKKVSYIPSSVLNGYLFDMETLDRVVQSSDHPRKLLVINSPNNPSGMMFKPEMLKELGGYCRKNNILILSDEIYFMLAHGRTPHISISQYYPEGTFVLGGLSKHLSIGGWRLGVGIMPDNALGKRLMEVLRVIASETWSSVAAPVQYAAMQAYSGCAELDNYIDECSQVHGIRTRYMYHALTELGITCTKPEGGFYMVANFDGWREELRQKNIFTSAGLAEYLLEVHSLATLSADSFGIPEHELSLRLATCYLDLETDADSDRLLDVYRSNCDPALLMNKSHHPNMHGAIAAFGDFIESLHVVQPMMASVI